jgi:hypothetical protein
LKTLLRDVLDPAVEHVQHAKTQRERIHNDNVYFTSSKHPENAPAWTYKEIHYETDDEFTKNYKMKRNTFVFKKEVLKERRRNIMEKGQDTMEKKLTKNILRV